MEVNPKCPPDHFARVVEALCDAGANTIHAGVEHFGGEMVIILVGSIIGSDLSGTLHRIESSVDVALQDPPLPTHGGTDETSSTRLRPAVHSRRVDGTFGIIRDIVAEKELHVIEPLAGGFQ